MIKALIFDCFGVIYGSSLHLAFQVLGGDLERDHEFVHDTLHRYNLGFIDVEARDKIIADHLGVSMAAWNKAYLSVDHKDRQLMDYITELHPRYKIGLLTNGGKNIIDHLFTPQEQKFYFDVMVISSDVGLVKPDPRIFTLMAERLSFQPAECLMIDDSPHNCAAAAEIGMQHLVYTDYGALKKELPGRLA